MSGIGSMMMTPSTAEMYTKILANMAEMNKQHAEVMKKYAESQTEAKKVEYKQQLEALEKQEAVEKEQFVAQATQKQTVPVTEDGKDDGKISFWSKLKNMGKGALKTVKGMFCDENGFSIKRTLTTVAVAAAGAALIAVTGGAAAPVLVAVGAGLGALNIGKGAIKAAAAKTDAEAEAAWQEIGGGTLEVGLAMTGAKAASGKTFTGGKISQTLKATGDCVKTTGKYVVKGVRHPQKSYRAASEFMKTEGKANWEAIFKSKNAKENKIAQIDKRYAKEIEGYQKQQQKLLDELTELRKDATKNAEKITKKEAEYNALNEKIENAENLRTTNEADYSGVVDDFKAINKEVYRQAMDEYADLSTRGTLTPKETARLNEVEALITKAVKEQGYLEGSNGSSLARNLTAKYLKEQISMAKERIAELKGKKSLTDAEKAELKALKEDIKATEKTVKDIEAVYDIEVRTQQIQNANNRIAQLKTQKEQLANEIKAKEAQIKAESDLAKKTDLNKELKELQAKDSRIDGLISDNQSMITSAKRALHKENTAAFIETAVKPQGLQLANATAATNGFLFGTKVNPEMQEVTVKAEKYDEMAQQLEEMQAARRKQLETYYKQQTTTNPINIFSGMNMGTNPLMYFNTQIPEII